MVLKLIKHEFKYLGRYLLLIWAGMILMIVSQRLLTELRESQNTIWQLVSGTAFGLLFFTLAAMFLVTFGAIVMRFYQNMFSGEGYLTFTLPVKASQIVFSKLFTGAVFMLVPLLIAGLVLVSYIRAPETWYLLYSGFIEFMAESDLPIYVLVIWGLSIVLAPVLQLLEFYTAMSLGQLANRNKIIFSIIAYIGIYVAKQFLGVIIWLSLLMGNYVEKIEMYPFQVVKYASIIGFVTTISLIVINWLIVNYLCKNKLNLE
ncbi:hypothetical protein EII17_04885 [Clostridiales bacterium COT073_COT-073]|nr:hypothetical protein EII17_04885 [Clostridiales bacterium COT073_COT-073]